MNRQIKFRIWNPDDKKMETPLVLAIVNDGTLNFKPLINCSDGNKAYKDYHLMQYTGVQDKNGKEIFESDLVHIWGGTNFNGVYEYDFYGVCEFLGGAFYINTKKCCYGFGDFEYCEVIGNIYKNLELLKPTENE